MSAGSILCHVSFSGVEGGIGWIEEGKYRYVEGVSSDDLMGGLVARGLAGGTGACLMHMRRWVQSWCYEGICSLDNELRAAESNKVGGAEGT
jgi:hypothetical protein